MRSLAKAFWVLGAVGIGLAASASSALAGPVEVVEEPGGNPCSPSCQVHVVGSSTMQAHVPSLGEITASACSEEFEMSFRSDGTGDFSDEEITGASCTQRPCETWTIDRMDEVGQDEVLARVSFCLTDLNGSEHKWCLMDAHIEELQPGSHDYVMSSAIGGVTTCVNHQGINVEIAGSWIFENAPFEIIHL